MRCHAAGGCLAMSAGHTESLVATGQGSEHLGTLLQVEVVGNEILELAVVAGYGRRINDQRGCLVATCLGNLMDIVLVVDEGPLFLQLMSQSAGRLVVAADNQSALQIVTGYGTHADATDANKIYCFIISHLFSFQSFNFQSFNLQ